MDCLSVSEIGTKQTGEFVITSWSVKMDKGIESWLLSSNSYQMSFEEIWQSQLDICTSGLGLICLCCAITMYERMRHRDDTAMSEVPWKNFHSNWTITSYSNTNNHYQIVIRSNNSVWLREIFTGPRQYFLAQVSVRSPRKLILSIKKIKKLDQGIF